MIKICSEYFEKSLSSINFISFLDFPGFEQITNRPENEVNCNSKNNGADNSGYPVCFLFVCHSCGGDGVVYLFLSDVINFWTAS